MERSLNCGRVHLAACEDEVLSGRHGVRHIARTDTGIVETSVGLLVSGRGGSAFFLDVGVVEHIIICLEELLGIGGLVVPEPFLVHTPLRVESDLRVGGGRALGRDHNHAVRSTGSVEGVGGGILQDGHRLDVIGVDKAEVSVERHTIDNDKRLSAGGDGADTTDRDAR